MSDSVEIEKDFLEYYYDKLMRFFLWNMTSDFSLIADWIFSMCNGGSEIAYKNLHLK